MESSSIYGLNADPSLSLTSDLVRLTAVAEIVITNDGGNRKTRTSQGKAMWLMLQTEQPEDFVIATGEVHSVREFVEKSFKHIGKTIVWEGKNENEVGRCKETGKIHVTVNHKYYRPTEVSEKSKGE
ncbi:GDP-mannose 4,6 dehydratase [Willisornis vidua]|uniref:GDP-mannose 4,6-dehydratase n=1 Tax=Willisornis vidua TaxID=1566151 RepID=A0ABQ9CX58_9PASS|nr:GDP-mannose 4,6 dehydratase [Willisornis vidua]